ncbi:hypothetical protein LY56_01722 [Roseinatronobacter thiooxidans]|uniref:Uncharacterized protein n=1 Tax=Roseinatronobacter thiooxidans TaxID=121821 RepID=A0A2W7QPA6_9RHOB|nr:hypothetical protein [Roseinatronobacter thiooxidans]PZX45697.1 hypothetical protein LY56_01722 [Roseinatronobacter thiooxidans]
MAGTVTWQITGTSSDGTKVIINVTATLNDDGSITVDYELGEDSADADIIGVYFDFFNDGGDLDTAGNGRGGSANNMKGYGDGFDAAFEEGKAGLKDGANTEGSITFTAKQLIEFGFGDFYNEDGELTDGAGLMEAFAETEIGIRATSTGDDGEGSLKIGAVGEYHPEDDDDNDFFPEWPQDISNAVFYIDTTGDGKWDVAVKIDEFPDSEEIGWISNDMDDFYACMFEYIKKVDDRVDDDSTLIGVSIKGGTGPDLFFAIENDENGPEPDEGPTMNTGPGTTEYQYDDFYEFYQEDCIA